MPTRPVVGAAERKLFRISKWMDRKLQPIIKCLPTYCTNSNQVISQFTKMIRELKEKDANSHKRYYLFIVDTVSMYANMLKEDIIDNHYTL